MLKIIATACKGYELKPGDLFSTVGPEYWDSVARTLSIGERVYIRMETDAEDAPDMKMTVYRIEVQR